MPGTNAFNIFGEFMKGYRDQSRQQAEDRMRKAQGLMDVAIKQAEIIDTSDLPEARAKALDIMEQVQKEYEKALKPAKGFLPTILGAFGGGKGKGKTLVDPLEAMGITRTEQYQQYIRDKKTREEALAAGSAKRAEAPEGTTPPSEASEISAPGAPAPQMPAGMGLELKPEPSVIGTGETTIPAIATQSQLGLTQIPGMAREPVKLGIGAKAPGTETGIGAEKIQIAPDFYDYRIDGVQVSPREYRGHILRMAERKSMQEMSATERAEIEKASRERVVWDQKNNLSAQQQRYNHMMETDHVKNILATGSEAEKKAVMNSVNEVAFGIQSPDMKGGFTKAPWVDQSTGARWTKFYAIDPITGRPDPTKEVIPAVRDEDNPMHAAIQGMLTELKTKNPAATYQDAVSEYGKRVTEDRELDRKIKQMELQGATADVRFKNAAADLKKREVDRTSDEYVRTAYKICEDFVKDAAKNEYVSAEEMFQQVAALMQKNFSIEWSRLLSVIGGGDPVAIQEKIANDVYGRKAGLTETGGRGAPPKGVVARPPDIPR